MYNIEIQSLQSCLSVSSPSQDKIPHRDQIHRLAWLTPVNQHVDGHSEEEDTGAPLCVACFIADKQHVCIV